MLPISTVSVYIIIYIHIFLYVFSSILLVTVYINL